MKRPSKPHFPADLLQAAQHSLQHQLRPPQPALHVQRLGQTSAPARGFPAEIETEHSRGDSALPGAQHVPRGHLQNRGGEEVGEGVRGGRVQIAGKHAFDAVVAAAGGLQCGFVPRPLRQQRVDALQLPRVEQPTSQPRGKPTGTWRQAGFARDAACRAPRGGAGLPRPARTRRTPRRKPTRAFPPRGTRQCRESREWTSR